MKKYLSILLALFAFCVSAADLVVASGKQGFYQIVIPDDYGSAKMNGYMNEAAGLVQLAVKKACGAVLPIVKESKRDNAKPAIIIGNTKSAKFLGCDKWVLWEHTIAVKGRDIYLCGRDRTATVKSSSNCYYALGSLKAACVFVEKFVNTRFIARKYGYSGVPADLRTLPLAKVTVPEKFSYRNKPRFVHCDWDKGGHIYTIGNNFYFDCDAEYRVHYHAYAIPYEKYLKTHPEYFAVINGTRGKHGYNACPFHCISNPEVQELFYQEALSRADKGFKVVELGQSDAFRCCECEKCQKLYNTKDWGEKLWCLHRDLAARLYKARPDIIVAIAAYGPTHKVPKSFKKFPGKGVIVDLASFDEKIANEFRAFNILGMATWTYNHGAYLASGFSPAMDFEALRQSAIRHWNSPVTSIYNCGLMVAPAINGPWLYAWGQYCNDPKTPAKTILSDYCRYGFGEKAAPYFIKFFSLIDRRLKFSPNVIEDYNDFSGNARRLRATEQWSLRYPPKVLAELEKLFAAGEKLASPKDDLLANLKTEFEYLKLSAKVCHALQQKDAPGGLAKLADAVEARNKFIAALPEKHGRLYGAFGNVKKSLLQDGGYMSGKFGGVFDSDPALLRQVRSNVVAVKVKDFRDPAWKNIKYNTLKPLNTSNPALDAKFAVAYRDGALLIKLQVPVTKWNPAPFKRDDAQMWYSNPLWEILIAEGTAIRHFAYSPVKGSCYDASISGKKENTKANWYWVHNDRFEKGIWYSELTLPFSNFPRKPEPGEAWQMQLAFSTNGGQTLYAWNVPIMGASFIDLTGYGDVRFGQRPVKERTVDINGNFAKRNKKNWPVGWSANSKFKHKLVEKDGKSSLYITTDKALYAGISYEIRRTLADDETAVVKVTLRGKGAAEIGFNWIKANGAWAVNDYKPLVALKPEGETRTCVFKKGIHAGKGAYCYRICIVMMGPGEMYIDKVELDIK